MVGLDLANKIEGSLKKLLSQVYILTILKGSANVENISTSLSLDKSYIADLIDKLSVSGLIKKNGRGYILSQKGGKKLKIVLSGGVFDVIHPGHVYTLNESKKLGDILVISVARDKTVLLNKGHEPLNNEEGRVKLVSNLKSVDLAILGNEKDRFKIVEQIKPDIIALGYDQTHNENLFKIEAKRRRLNIKIVRLDSPMPNIKTSKIVKSKEVFDEFNF